MRRHRFFTWRGLIVVGFIAAAAGVFVAFGPPKMLARSETPDFCASCHVMEAQYEAWFHEGAHRRVTCVDCHLPHTNVAAHYAWKSIDGMKDVYMFYSGNVPDEIRVSDHAKKVLQQNCIRCHEVTVDMIDSTRQCWDCHRRLSHVRSGVIEVR